MRCLLIGVRIEAAKGNIPNTQSKALYDSLCQDLQPGSKWPLGIGHRRLILRICIM